MPASELDSQTRDASAGESQAQTDTTNEPRGSGLIRGLQHLDPDATAAPAKLERKLGLHEVLNAVLGVSDAPPRIGPYLLRRKVGEGGMGHVFLATDPAGQPVAIKVLRKVETAVRARFGREVAILQRISHPGVVQIRDHGWDEEGEPYLAMEWLEGHDLAQALTQPAPAVEEVLTLGMAIADAMQAAHDVGVLHRDLKPSNIFLLGGELARAKVIDFGLARRVDTNSQSRLTATGALVGTPAYLAPELFSQAGDVRADVYGLGATLFEVLAGRPPFVGATPGEVFVQVLQQPAPELNSLGVRVSGPLNALIARMLAKHPDVRPRDMRAVRLILAEIRQELEQERLRARGDASKSTPSRGEVEFGEERTRSASTSAVDRQTGTDADADALQRDSNGAQAETWPLLGRERELGMLVAIRNATTADGVARSVHLVGERGVGKSRLAHALGRSWVGLRLGISANQDGDPAGMSTVDVPGALHVLHVRCSEREQGEPFSLLRRVLERAIELARDHGPEDQARASHELLDAIYGVATGAAEPMKAEELRLRWLDAARDLFVSTHTCIVDDAHLADDVSMRFLAAAFLELGDWPWLLILSSRPGADADTLGHRWGRPFDEIVEVRPLARRWMHLLAQRLSVPADSVTDHSRGTAIESGRPGALVDLHTSGRGRVDLRQLEPPARRLLAQAAVLGTSFPYSELVGLAADVARDVDPWLIDLERRALLRRDPAQPGHDSQVKFVDSTVHQAVLRELDDDEARSYHLAAARRLSKDQSPAFARIAAHYRAAGASDLAAQALLSVARLLAAAERHLEALETVDQALTLQPSAEVRRDLELLRADAAVWSGDLVGALTRYQEIAAASEAGTLREFRALSGAVHCLGQLGDNSKISSIDSLARARIATDQAARDEQMIVICRSHCQLVASETLPYSPLRVPDTLAPLETPDVLVAHEARAWFWRARAVDFSMNALGRSIDASIQSHREYRLAQNHRLAVLGQILSASLSTWAGDFAAAEASTAPVPEMAQRLGAPFLATWAAYADAKRRFEVGEFHATLEVLRAMLPGLERAPRMAAGVLVYVGSSLIELGDLEPAQGSLAQALERHPSASTRAAAYAGLARIFAHRGEVQAALSHVREARQIQQSRGRLFEFGTWVLWAAASVEISYGDLVRGVAALEEAESLLALNAESFDSPFRASSYLTGTRVNRRIGDLRAQLRGTSSNDEEPASRKTPH